MVLTPDFLFGVFVNIPFFMMFNHYCLKGRYDSTRSTAITLLILCIVFAFFKNKLIPRKWRQPFSLPISGGWVVACSIVMAVFIAIYSTVEYHVSFNAMVEHVLPVCWLFGLLLMILSNSARVPWLVLTNICLLGLLVYNVSNDGRCGDGRFDGADGNYDANLPDDSIWANFSSDTPVTDAAPDTGITDFSLTDYDALGIDSSMTATPLFTPLDTWGTFSLADTSFGTDVPQFTENPYMALSTGVDVNDSFQICDASGRPELSITNGNIFNSENIITGHINYNPTLHMTTYTDAANMPFMHVDQANNIYTADNCYMGHYTDSGNIRTVFDSKGSVAYRVDKLTNTIYEGKLSNIIGKIIKN